MQFLRFSLLVLLISSAVLPPPALADGPGDGHPWTLSLRSDVGDVLRPKRASGDYSWFIGLDGGLTYSSFSGGPLTYFFMPGPYNPRHPLIGAVNEGSGLGFYLGATVDLPLSDIFGIVIKGNYHTRTGSFDYLTSFDFFDVQTNSFVTANVNSKTDWTFNYIGADLLLRANLGELPLYLLAGPSFGFLQSNKAKLDQSVLSPDNVFYLEDDNGQDVVINNRRTAAMEGEVNGFEDTRIDLKLGAGYWLELNKDLFFTPEITVAIPMTDFVKPGEISADESGNEFNMLTAFFTIGLRWRMN